jgi:glyoxylase-like metal-dependent hydrolase (beta-lactamase superfamily II)
VAAVSADELEVRPEAPWLRRFPVRTPTLPPAMHTNVYVVGEGELVVVDPASPYPEEQERLLAYLDGLRLKGNRVAAVLLSHHHYDHIAGAGGLCQALAVPLYAHEETARRVARRGLVVDHTLDEGDRLPFSSPGLRCLHTPGHAPGHLCLVEEQADGGGRRNAVVGDMVASVGTIVVDPDDDGDMATYLAQIGRLRELGPLRLWPAHGASVEDGGALLSFYIAHRLMREGKVVMALQARAGTLSDLVPLAYDDVPPAIHALAARSLLAHLLKLQREGRARVDDDGVWRPA